MTLYRFPIDELDKYGLKSSEVPYFRKPSIDDLDEETEEHYLKLEKEFPEDVLFSLSDLVEFYDNFALRDERIKEFVEKIKSFVEQNSC